MIPNTDTWKLGVHPVVHAKNQGANNQEVKIKEIKLLVSTSDPCTNYGGKFWSAFIFLILLCRIIVSYSSELGVGKINIIIN